MAGDAVAGPVVPDAVCGMAARPLSAARGVGPGLTGQHQRLTAPPPLRLFARTPYGISVWACFLYERYASLRPLNQVSAWLSGLGLPIAAGTLAGSVERFIPVFGPVADAILAHQNQQAVRHGDETGWRVQALRETGRSSRAWLWTSVSSDAVYYRGRDAGCPAPPAQIRTGPLGHPAPPLGSAPHSADGKSLVWPRVSDFQPGPMGLRGRFERG